MAPHAVVEPDVVMEIPVMAQVLHNAPPPQYEVLPNATIRGGDLLVSNIGYYYTRKADNRAGRKQRWRCINKNKGCKGAVTEDVGTYVPGPQQHNCQPEPRKNNKHSIV